MTNRELAERAYAALNRDDFEGFLALIDPDVEFTSLIAEAEGRTYRGPAGVREWWANIKNTLGGLRWAVHEIRDVGADSILVKIEVRGELEGAPIAQTMFQTVEGRDDLVVWWAVFRTEEEALQALEDRQ